MSQDEIEIRKEKLSSIRAQGVDPYPHLFKPDSTAESLNLAFNGKEVGHSEDAAQKLTPKAKVAGRLVLFRAMGKNAFAQIQDATGRIQVMFNREGSSVAGYTPTEDFSAMKWIEKMCDLGDWIGVEGHLFRTQKGELTIFADETTLLSKALLPLPDKHQGLQDKETRYRKRWLDLISNSDVRKTFLMRSRILAEIRSYLSEHGYLEVETPVLQSIYGGADAKPFTTNLHALDQDMFLRISLEPPLKKLIVGGLDRIFEMGKVFRNEGIDRSHNPEFTLLEAYGSYMDYNDVMVLVEKLFERIALKLLGTTEVQRDGVTLNLKTPWKRISMVDAIKEYGNLDIHSLSDEQMKKILLDSGHIDPAKFKTMQRGNMIQALFEVFAEPHLIQPHHVIDHPIETTPFCKRHRDPKISSLGFVERFETFIMGYEMCNAYTELNDPELQKELLLLQAKRRDKGDEEAAPYDEDFVEAIAQGMPPTGGFGIGIDRLVMLFTGEPSIRDVLYFPWMKP